MSWWGKLVGGAFGFMMGGPLGAVLGAALGHTFDKGLSSLPDGIAPGQQERVQTAFFTATFSVMGAVAKADGRVSKHEIRLAETLMSQMGLHGEMRRTAIRLFSEGKAPDFPLDDVLQQFRAECRGRRTLIRMFVEIQLQAAYADGRLHNTEEQLLLHICNQLGFSTAEFRALEQMLRAQQHYAGAGAGAAQAARPTLDDAYAVLGVDPGDTDAQVKKAYRRLISQHHPDKLVSKGLPEEMMKVASRKTHEIKQAYEQIMEARRN